ncbi:hypothetical protein R3P38DRAFT_2763052 [Favolaschia claudopus]|uniref:Uncharacterized protein n=1 Tax=Favolaschia claudopus TaxID=2862362 RepID=A0AAW0DP61_9AGAR
MRLITAAPQDRSDDTTDRRHTLTIPPGTFVTHSEPICAAWAASNPLPPTPHQMGVGSRRPALDEHVNNWNILKIHRLQFMLRNASGLLEITRLRAPLLRALASRPPPPVSYASTGSLPKRRRVEDAAEFEDHRSGRPSKVTRLE